MESGPTARCIGRTSAAMESGCPATGAKLNERFMRIAAIILIVAASALMPAHLQAQERMEFIPSLSLFTVYDDNLFARTQGTAGQMLQLRPSFEGNFESPTV